MLEHLPAIRIISLHDRGTDEIVARAEGIRDVFRQMEDGIIANKLDEEIGVVRRDIIDEIMRKQDESHVYIFREMRNQHFLLRKHQHLIVGDEMIIGIIHAKIGRAAINKGDHGKREAKYALRMAEGAAVENDYLIVEMQGAHSAEQLCTRYGKSLERWHMH